MGMRVRLVLGLLVAGAVVLPAQASAESMRTFPVPTGGFAIGLPSSWIDVSKAAPSVLKQLEKVPSFRAFAQAASQNGSLKLIAADPAGKGTVYMNVGAARLPGPYSVKQVATATAAQLKKTLGPKGSVSAYVLVKNQVEYVIVYVAPHTTWKKHEALFTSSARSFRFLASPNLSKIILSPAQVGKGYKLSAFPFGTSFIGESTLDLCAASYPSEGLRTGRLQVRYTPKGSGVDVSNEIVRYASGGAQEAIGEVATVARACAKTPAVLTQGNVKEVYKVAPLKDPKLPSGAVAVKLTITVSKGKQTQAQTGVAIYQVKGDTLSGVYAFVGKGSSYADAQRIAFHAAEQSAKNLGGGSTGFTA
jgi:hypothetical protein